MDGQGFDIVNQFLAKPRREEMHVCAEIEQGQQRLLHVN
jgi:hypothetical protein